ncbi:DUF4136 domain-containing protein [uncultured Imperialibacter sp.]|jgi:hypothetical protein|uniref:DUF4136 domain-containing protein n=1 Tax=Imperialibacter sp. TaxID=2038411 RepID=UPI0030D95FEC|tara:strand:- start:407 stop:1021 length:615 start_codon:yes stop_codon:yes gene_type:complete
MIYKNSLILVGIVAVVVSCNVYKEVQVFQNKEVDFGQYKSFAWLPETDQPGDTATADDFIRKRTRNYFRHCISQRALRPDTVNPQLLLSIEWLSHSREINLPPIYDLPEFFDVGYYYGPAPDYTGRKLTSKAGHSNLYLKPESFQYIHGGVKFTVIDRQTNQVIWEGVAQGDLYGEKVIYEDLHPAIHKMMRKFPLEVLENDNN